MSEHRALCRRCGDREYVQRNGGGRSRRACLHPPRAPQESRGQDCGHRLLCATRARGTGRDGGRGRGGGQQPQGAGAGDHPGFDARTGIDARSRADCRAGRQGWCRWRRCSRRAGTSARAFAAPIWADDRFAHSFIEDVHWGDAQLAPGEQTRPNLKIQEGCGNRCTFCVIPFTRGPSKSLPHAVVMRQVESFVAAGGKELVLSGINLGRWGRDFEGSDCETLARLVREILEETALPRLRLSSIEPMDWNDELIALIGEFGGRRLARHAHLPLQSGSDAVLRRMHRRYRPWHYAEKVRALVARGWARAHAGRRRDGGVSRRNATANSRRRSDFLFARCPSATCTCFRFRRGRARAAGHCMQLTLLPRGS